jgi:hypothetical protein|tara:strand:- start:277 stop:537 length:261 start_codon:yes stop_codon:yes gene_type:complete
MGEIKKYDSENDTVFTNIGTRGPTPKPDVAEVKLLNAGEYWSEPHNCGRDRCNQLFRLQQAARRYFGKGNYSSAHTNGILAVLRKV